MFQRLLKKISQALNSASIPYMIIGGQAVLLYGEPRLTKDIDITLGIGTDSFDKIEELVKKLRLKILSKDSRTFAKRTMVLPVADEKSGIRIDLIFSFSPYERQAIARARKVTFDEVDVNFASLEDVVIHKIVAGRPRDIEDVKSILLKNPAYDMAYISKWLKEFDSSLDGNYQNTFNEIVAEIRSA